MNFKARIKFEEDEDDDDDFIDDNDDSNVGNDLDYSVSAPTTRRSGMVTRKRKKKHNQSNRFDQQFIFLEIRQMANRNTDSCTEIITDT